MCVHMHMHQQRHPTSSVHQLAKLLPPIGIGRPIWRGGGFGTLAVSVEHLATG